MVNFKFFNIFLLILFLTFTVNAVNNIYNEGGDYNIQVSSQKQVIYNDNMTAHFSFKVQNLKSFPQNFRIDALNIKGWDVLVNPQVFKLQPNEIKNITLDFIANSEFDYSTSVVGPDIIKISQKNNYKGYFEFPVNIIGLNQNISLRFQVEIDKKETPPVNFITKIPTSALSPISPLRYTITASNLESPQQVEINVELAGKSLADFKDTFSSKNNYKIYQQEISSEMTPGVYDAKITIRLPKNNEKSAYLWYENKNLVIKPYEKLDISKSFTKSFFADSYVINVHNSGNVESVFVHDVNASSFKLFFFHSNYDFKRTPAGIEYDISLKKAEDATLKYSYNYLPLYIIFIIILIFGIYVYIRKNSNPLDVETKIYEVKKVMHEGVKSLKVRIGFENIKEEQIDELKIIFRMPSYLNIKENSFILVEPNHVLKGKDQYKLIWDFKKFEKEDSRIIGFTLVNNKGVLGDIRIPDIEIDVKVKGKLKKYSKSFPVIRG